MNQPQAVKLSDKAIQMRPRGDAEFTKLDFSKVVVGDTSIVWDPGLEGVYGKEAYEESSPNQPGERHLDSNEVLYLISGAMSLQLEAEDGTTTEVPLRPGEAVITPQGTWHRLIVNEPSRYLWFGSGRTELRNG
jgi:mannose-6-phosphate isomerase-like protein (cupin superfamily)